MSKSKKNTSKNNRSKKKNRINKQKAAHSNNRAGHSGRNGQRNDRAGQAERNSGSGSRTGRPARKIDAKFGDEIKTLQAQEAEKVGGTDGKPAGSKSAGSKSASGKSAGSKSASGKPSSGKSAGSKQARPLYSKPDPANLKSFPAAAGICFAVIILLFMVTSIVMPDKKFSSAENRMLQEKPSFSAEDYAEGRFEKQTEDYVNDQFPLRNKFVRTKAAVDKTEGKLESNGVIRCRDDYLMERLQAPDAENMAKLQNSLAAFREKHEGIPMYFLLAPNAANILSDKLPKTVRLENQNKYMDEFFAKTEKAGFNNIDVRSTFKNSKKSVQLYYRTDHHWTSDGAYLAYQKAMKVIHMGDALEYAPHVVKNDFCGTLYSRSGFVNGRYDAIKIYLPKDDTQYEEAVIYYSDTKEKTTGFFQVDNLQKKDAYTVFGGSNHPMYTIRTTSATNEKLLVIKDSYANSFIPFLSQHYREIVVVDPRYYFESIEDLMETEGITQVLFLYNANTLFRDTSLQMMLDEE